MQKEFERLHQKLDFLLADVKQIKALLAPQNRQENISTKLYTISEAADYLRLSVSRIYELKYEGKLVPIQRKKFSHVLFTTEHLNRYLNAKATALASA